MAGKYDPLREYLSATNAKAVYLTFADIEKIIGDTLPPSARQYQEWGANASPNTGHPCSQA